MRLVNFFSFCYFTSFKNQDNYLKKKKNSLQSENLGKSRAVFAQEKINPCRELWPIYKALLASKFEKSKLVLDL